MHPSWMQMMRLFVPLHLAVLVINVANWGGRNTAYRLHLDEPKDLQIGGGISETPLKCRELRLAAIHLWPLEGGPNRRPFWPTCDSGNQRALWMAAQEAGISEDRKAGRSLSLPVSTSVHWPSAASMAAAF